jgi:hypothetical protein
MNPIVAAGIAAACIVIAPLLAWASEQPDATLDLSGYAVGLGVGVNWATGTLHYQGKAIPVTVKGLSLATLGVTNVSATADVYHLSKLSDFAGNYTAVSAGATLADGGEVTAMENSHRVVIRMRAENRGVELKLGVDGVAVALK